MIKEEVFKNGKNRGFNNNQEHSNYQREPMIEFQFFKGCPNSEATLNNLKELIIEGFIQEEELKIVNVPDLKSAEKLLFQGSPTVLFNGYDLYNESKPNSYNYSCRIYNFGKRKTGIMPKNYIKKKIKKLRNNII